ncbi:MAG: hypothetical protein ACMUIU_04545 [bacterium]
MFFLNKYLLFIVCVLIVVTFLFAFFTEMQVFAQTTSVNNLILNPFVFEIALLSNMISTLSSPFSFYTNDPYSSYYPYSLPYSTIPNSADFNPFPYPFNISNTTGINLQFNTYDIYNPVSFLNSGYPDLSIIAPGFPYINESIGLNLLSPVFQPNFTGLTFPFFPTGFFPGFLPYPFAL